MLTEMDLSINDSLCSTGDFRVPEMLFLYLCGEKTNVICPKTVRSMLKIQNKVVEN